MSSKHSFSYMHVLDEALLNEKMCFNAWYIPHGSCAV